MKKNILFFGIIFGFIFYLMIRKPKIIVDAGKELDPTVKQLLYQYNILPREIDLIPVSKKIEETELIKIKFKF